MPNSVSLPRGNFKPDVGRVIFRAALVTLISLVAAASSEARQSDPVFGTVGLQNRPTLSLLPFEHIDLVTGNLVLQFTDLTLPGNAGFDLQFIRTYNSQDGLWRFGVAGVPMWFTTAAVGDLSDVTFFTADGAGHRTSGYADVTYTAEFWRFTKSTRTLALPNGVEAVYEQVPNSDTWFLTQFHDAFDNTVTLTWGPVLGGPQLTVTQQLGAGQSRTVDFDQWTVHSLATMTYDGRIWSYSWTGLELNTVSRPAGQPWSYRYATISGAPANRAIDQVTTPSGGTVGYAYTTATVNHGGTTQHPFVVSNRTTGGRAPSGTSTFEYYTPATVAHTPTAWLSFWWTDIGDQAVQTRRTVTWPQGGALLEDETLTYETVSFEGFTIPILASRTLVRGSRTLTTTYGYSVADFKDYGNPHTITETGELGTRTTTIDYRHDFSRYIKARVASVSADGFTRSYSYNTDTGFLETQSIYGVETQFAPDGFGNVGSATDANNRMTTFSYEWGVLRDTNRADAPVSRGVNADGTMASETVGTMTTRFLYDDMGRTTKIWTDTAGRADTHVDYNWRCGTTTATTAPIT